MSHQHPPEDQQQDTYWATGPLAEGSSTRQSTKVPTETSIGQSSSGPSTGESMGHWRIINSTFTEGPTTGHLLEDEQLIHVLEDHLKDSHQNHLLEDHQQDIYW